MTYSGRKQILERENEKMEISREEIKEEIKAAESVTEEPAGEPAADVAEPQKKQSTASVVKEWIRDILIAVVIAVLILQFIKPTIVKESSMEPTLYENHYIFLSKQAYTLFGEPKRGDIVVFHSGLTALNGGEKLLIKRVIGLPGDTIAIMDGKVYLNGEVYKEAYIKDGTTNGYIEPYTVPEGQLFCMGDNRLVSVDSRDYRVGCVDIDSIVGKAVFRLAPLKLIGSAGDWVDDSKEAARIAGDLDYAE